MPDNFTTGVPAADRVLNILEFVAQQRDSSSVKEISEHLHIPYTSAFRLVKLLISRDYLEEDDQRSGYYHLGLQVLSLFNGMTYINDLRQVAHLELDRLAVESRQVVQLGILKGKSVTYIEQILPPNPVILYTAPYSVLPLNISAAGKVLAAFSSPTELHHLLEDTVFSKQTPKTIDNVPEFIQHLNTVRLQGYAVDDEEFSLGIGCLAAPIFNFERRCVAAVGVTGGIHDYHGEAKQALADMLLRYAQEISLKLGMPQKKD